jgi:hypothetical protein
LACLEGNSEWVGKKSNSIKNTPAPHNIPKMKTHIVTLEHVQVGRALATSVLGSALSMSETNSYESLFEENAEDIVAGQV